MGRRRIPDSIYSLIVPKSIFLNAFAEVIGVQAWFVAGGAAIMLMSAASLFPSVRPENRGCRRQKDRKQSTRAQDFSERYEGTVWFRRRLRNTTVELSGVARDTVISNRTYNAVQNDTMNKLPYYTLPDPPEKMTATNLMIRFVDSLGFRYRWATEGLREEDMEFQTCDSSMKLSELLAHIHGLITSTDAFITGNEREKIEPISLEKRRKKTLDLLVKIRESLLILDDDYLEKRRYMVPWADREYPIWFLINGPLSDAFTHVGQVASWRRINDNPIPGANVFYGTPPK